MGACRRSRQNAISAMIPPVREPRCRLSLSLALSRLSLFIRPPAVVWSLVICFLTCVAWLARCWELRGNLTIYDAVGLDYWIWFGQRADLDRLGARNRPDERTQRG